MDAAANPRQTGPSHGAPPAPAATQTDAVRLAAHVLWARATPDSEMLFFVTSRSEIWSVGARVASRLERFLGAERPSSSRNGDAVLSACVHAGILESDGPIPATEHADVKLVSATPPWNTHQPNDGEGNDGWSTSYRGGPF